MAHLISIYHFSYSEVMGFDFKTFFNFYFASFSLPYNPYKNENENTEKESIKEKVKFNNRLTIKRNTL